MIINMEENNMSGFDTYFLMKEEKTVFTLLSLLTLVGKNSFRIELSKTATMKADTLYIKGVFELYRIMFEQIVYFMLDEVADDDVGFAAVRQCVACPANEILCLFQIQFQCQGQGNGGGFGGSVIRIAADFGKMLLGQEGLLVDGGVFLTGLIDEFQQSFRKTRVGLLQHFLQRQLSGRSLGSTDRSC